MAGAGAQDGRADLRDTDGGAGGRWLRETASPIARRRRRAATGEAAAANGRGLTAGPRAGERSAAGGRAVREGVRVVVIDPHPIYRGGLRASLAALDDVDSVVDLATVAEAWEDPALAAADVVLVDHGAADGVEFIRRLRARGGARVIVCASGADEARLLETVQAGAVGYLCKDSLTPEVLAAGVQAAASGAGVMAPELLGSLLRSLSRISEEVLEPRGLSLTRLSSREQKVLRLVAEGCPTREVARRLCYSERTIKNVIHDVVTKLNVRTRSQAVAHAVREGLI
jgi:DNA-binding NarL/FixJ family response regulator